MARAIADTEQLDAGTRGFQALKSEWNSPIDVHLGLDDGLRPTELVGHTPGSASYAPAESTYFPVAAPNCSAANHPA